MGLYLYLINSFPGIDLRRRTESFVRIQMTRILVVPKMGLYLDLIKF